MRCPVCHARPSKRACPALGRTICPVCCGSKRQVEIRCPDDCPYLSAARAHPAASVRRQQDEDVAAITPALAGLSEPRQQLFLYSLALVGRFTGEGLDAAGDADVAAAAAALAATYETESRGVIYEHRPDSLAARRIAEGIRGVYDQLGRGRPSGFAADAAAVMRQVESLAQDVQRASPGEPRAFLALADRLAARLGRGDRTEGESATGAPAAPPSPIIIP